MVILVVEDGLDTRGQEQRNGGHVAPPRGELSPVVSVVYQDSTGIHTGKYQITVYWDPSSGNNRYTNKAHQGPTQGIYQNYSNRASLRFYIKFCTSTYPSNKGLANCNTSEMNLNARDTRYINPKVLTSAVEREGVADGGTGGSGTRPSLNTGPDFPPSRGVFSLVSDAFV